MVSSMRCDRHFGRMMAMVAGLAFAATVGAQAPAPAAAPAQAAKPAPAAKTAKAAKKPAVPEFKLVVEPRAMDLLKAMSAKLAAAKTLSFTATSPALRPVGC